MHGPTMTFSSCQRGVADASRHGSTRLTDGSCPPTTEIPSRSLFFPPERSLSRDGDAALVLQDDAETPPAFEERLMHWIAQMMFVSGETAEPSAETTWMIEEIVREQVLEMVCAVRPFVSRDL